MVISSLRILNVRFSDTENVLKADSQASGVWTYLDFGHLLYCSFEENYSLFFLTKFKCPKKPKNLAKTLASTNLKHKNRSSRR